jgi:hypothetical protein
MSRQTYNGTEEVLIDNHWLTADCFAYVGDERRPETWKLPIRVPNNPRKTLEYISLAMTRFDQTAIPPSQRDAVWQRIQAANRNTPRPWRSSMIYRVGDKALSANQDTYEVVGASGAASGVSGQYEPFWPQAGRTVTDGTITWQNVSSPVASFSFPYVPAPADLAGEAGIGPDEVVQEQEQTVQIVTGKPKRAIDLNL